MDIEQMRIRMGEMAAEVERMQSIIDEQQSPAVAVPDEHPWRESMNSNHRSYAEGFNACRAKVLNSNQSPQRVTEQDAIDLRRYRWLRDSDNFPMDDIPGDSIWDSLCEKDRADFDEFIDFMMDNEEAGAAELLAKLNDKSESVWG